MITLSSDSKRITCACNVVNLFLRLPEFLSIEEFAHLALHEHEPRFDMLAFRFPSYGREHSSDHAHVAAAEFLMDFGTHQINLSYTDSDNVIIQQETETQYISQSFNFLLYSQAVAVGLLVELLTSGVEHPADILADATLPLTTRFISYNIIT